MGSLQNPSLFDGRSAERRCENDFNNSCGDLLERQKASVTREFPPGYGPKAPYNDQPECTWLIIPPDDKVNLGIDKNATSVDASECGNDSGLVNISVLKQLVKNLVKAELTDSLEGLVGKVVTETCMANGVDLSSILEPKILETMGVSKKLSGVENQTGESKTISDIGSISDGTMRDVAKQCYPTVGLLNKSSDAILEIDLANKGKIAPEKSSLEIKFPRRRVTVVREYPPFCGRNVPFPTNEERLMITSGNKMMGKEIKGFAARDVPLKRRNVEEFPRPLKKTVRVAHSENNLVRERASDAKKNNLVSHGKPSNTNKGAQAVDRPNKARDKVRETLALFRAYYEELLQREAAKVGRGEKGLRRVDLEVTKIMKEKRKEVNTEQMIGSVPGVEVGDEFVYRVELCIIGLHRQHQGGIDYMKRGSLIIATSIVASEGYSDDMGNSDVLIYSGQGGNVSGRKNGPPEDQKLERGNLALKNSISARTPVRVTRGFKKTENSSMNPRARVVTYTYDGLYTVEKYWSQTEQHGKLVYKFELKRIPGQPRVAWKRSVVKIQKWS